jgi:ABC-2 type transport system ATP-binding protein
MNRVDHSGALLSVVGLSKSYADGAKADAPAVDNLSFALRPGEIVGLLGPNGAGKTTTLKSLCGLILPDAGSIRIAGVDLARRRVDALGHVAAMLEGTRSLFPRLTVRENLNLIAALHGIRPRQAATRIDDLLQAFGLTAHRDAPAQTLSTGMLRRAAVTACLVKDTQLILLDEPTLGLDVHSARDLCELIRNVVAAAGRAVLVSSHDMQTVERLASRVLIMMNGRLVTNESVSSLIDRFRTQIYQTRTASRLSSGVRHLIVQRFPTAVVEDDACGSVVTLELGDGREIYLLMEMLGGVGTDLESMARHRPTLEEAFLSVTLGSAS